MSEKNLDTYIDDIILNIDFCLNSTEDMTLEELENDEILLSAISFRFIRIAEISKDIQMLIGDAAEIPWNKIIGLRNRMVHDYGSIRYDIVWDTIKRDLPIFKEQIMNIRN